MQLTCALGTTLGDDVSSRSAPLIGENPTPMPHGSPQFTPKQLLDAGQRAEAEGRLDLAYQFYEHLSDRYGHAPEAAEGRNGLERVGTGVHYPQVWQPNGAIPARPTADGRAMLEGAGRAKHSVRSEDYRIGRTLAAFASGIGGLAMVVALLALAAGLAADLAPVPVLQELKNAHDLLPWAAGALLVGAVSLLCGQMARALFDQASATRELVAIERVKAGLEP
jgi:hypothetical protein